MSESSTANDAGYKLARLTVDQHRLLLRLRESSSWIALAASEIAASTGLEHRAVPLLLTYRGRKHAFARPTGTRLARLTIQGRTVAKRLPNLAEAELPLGFDECATILNTLAEAVLDEKNRGQLRALAGAAKKALRRPRSRK